MTNNEQKLLDVAHMTETAINGVAHLMTVADWEQFLAKRIADSNNGVQPLSADFILEHKNDIRLDLLNLWCQLMVGMGQPGYDLNFFHRFWAFMSFDGMNDVNCITAKKVLGDKYAPVEQMFKGQIVDLDSTNVLDLDTVDKQVGFLPSLLDYEKKPYFYDTGILKTMLEFLPDIPDSFIEKFIHLVSFPCLFDNQNINTKRKDEILAKFSVRIGRTHRFLFPDGSVVKQGDYRDGVTTGNAYLDNVQRYATEDEKAIKAIVKKFPRAILDCTEGDNALVMK